MTRLLQEDKREIKMSNGKYWPIGIVISIIFVIIICGITIYIALLQPVQEDTDLMLDYHTLDAQANKIIVANISFNQKYTLTYIGEGVSLEGSTLMYKLVDKKGKAINSADFEVILSRPITSDNEVVLDTPSIKNGTYAFNNIKVSEKGRWNILAKISIADEFRHMNLKSNTFEKSVYEYSFDKPMRNAGANN